MIKILELKLFFIFVLLIFSNKTFSQSIEWFPFGSGMSTAVKAVAVVGNDVYVGGLFSSAGGVPANRIARWDGNSWHSLSTGTNGEVRALAVIGNDLYVGGLFSTAGGVPVNNIAKWDGSNWSAVGSGVNQIILTLTVDGNNLYAGGFFTEAGGVPANKIAKWDGSSWSAFGLGINNEVNSIAASGNTVYAGGYFNSAGGNTISSIAKWDGTNWSSLGSGISGIVSTIVIVDNDVYVGGSFSTAGGISANNIAKWDGTNWHTVSGGLNGRVLVIKNVNNDLYIGGMFTNAGGNNVNRLVRYNINNSTWNAIGNGTSGGIDAMAISGNDNSMVIGGAFSHMNGNILANYVGKFKDNENPLPVELTSFTANINDNNIILNWTTASETNNRGFEIQRTDDRSQTTEWDVVGFVEGNGTTTEFNNYSFTDNNLLELNGKYSYRLKQIDFDGKFEYSNIVEVEIGVPQEFSLSQNYPNPFNPETEIRYQITEDSKVMLKVFDILGNEVTTLVNENQSAGKYNIKFDSNNLSSGVYYYQLRAGNFIETKKMILLK